MHGGGGGAARAEEPDEPAALHRQERAARQVHPHVPRLLVRLREPHLGLAVQPGEITLVTGWVKTSSDWMATVFYDSSKETRASLRLSDVSGLGAALDIGGASVKRTIGPTSVRQGKSPKGYRFFGMDGFRQHRKNQCVFVSRYRVKKRAWLRSARAVAGPHELPPSDKDSYDALDRASETIDDTSAEEDVRTISLYFVGYRRLRAARRWM